MDNDTVCCVVCKKQEQNSSKVVSCLYCFSAAHYKCRNILGSAITRVKANMYFCTPNCSEIYKRIVDMQNSRSSMMSLLASELKETVANVVADQLTQVKSEVRSVTAAVEKSQEFLSAKFDEIVSDFKDLKAENETLRQQLSALSKSHSDLTSFVHQLEANVDLSDRRAISNNAVLLGLPNIVNENTMSLVEKTFVKIGINLPLNSIASASRLYVSKNNDIPVPIQIAFRNKNVKQLVLNRARETGTILSTNVDQSLVINGKATRITVRDELTSLSMELLRKMREYQDSFKIKFVWPARGGGVLVKKDENSSSDLIKSREDLKMLINRYSANHKQTPSPKRKKNDQN